MNDPFSDASFHKPPRGHQAMVLGDLSIQLHMPKATRSRFDERGTELVQKIAPSALAETYDVSDFPNAPAHWARTDSTRGVVSHFTVVEPGHMAWLDLRQNESHSHHVAAVISDQGLNALSRQEVTRPVKLEQYVKVCPTHGTRFDRGRFCEACNYEWPAQNYVATTKITRGMFWNDGWRTQDGKTRERIFTEDVARGVAAARIHDERINAFGVALFLSKQPKPRPNYGQTRGGGWLGGALEATRSIEIGAGALVNQTVEADDRSLDFWKETPDVMFLIYYVGQVEFESIVGSVPERRGNDFDKTPVGNP